MMSSSTLAAAPTSTRAATAASSLLFLFDRLGGFSLSLAGAGRLSTGAAGTAVTRFDDRSGLSAGAGARAGATGGAGTRRHYNLVWVVIGLD
jgi:hypothetical protein